jgi:hypothetical protein
MSEQTKVTSRQDDPVETTGPQDTGLSEQELDEVSGGLNPQPLPPFQLPNGLT